MNDRALAQQHLAVLLGDATDDDQRVLVMHSVALLANPAFAIVIGRYLAGDQRAAG
jgi:hypothetical protein